MFNLQGSYTTPLANNTDDHFLVDGNLGGPTKFPEYMGGLIINVMPVNSLNMNISFNYTAPVVGQTVPEVQYYGQNLC